MFALPGCRGRKTVPPTDLEEESNPSSNQVKEKGVTDSQHSEVRFPRRLLFIQISNYTSLNPLGPNDPSKPEQTKVAAFQLAQVLKVPTQKDSQVYLVTDSPPPPGKNLPTREVVVGAYERFLDSSKPDDRIIVYFGGHALEVDGKVYIAPIEGDRHLPKTLIPLQDFYSKLKACKAIQKVVIWDVCRFNPDRGRPKPGSEMMTPSLLKALASRPEGVEVVVTCTAGEHALEFANRQIEPSGPRYSGSAFLEAMRFIIERNRTVGVVQVPVDPILVTEWVAVIGMRVSEVAGSQEVGMKQTVRYYGNKDGKSDKTADPIETPVSSKSSHALVQAIVEEFRLPPIKNIKPAIVLTEYPYKDDAMAAYKSDISLEEIKKNKQKREFCNATLNAFQTIREVWAVKPKGGGLQQRDSVTVPITNTLKNSIKKELEAWAIGITRLEQVGLELEKISGQKKSQLRRWQAHYDYVRATVKHRLAFMNEYDKLMGDVLTETLPPLDKTLNQSSYKLISSEKMKSKKDIQKLAEEALEAFDGVIAEYKDTPWAIQSKYEKSVPLGLVWQPSK